MAKLNTKESIVDYLKSKGEDSSYSARKRLAVSMGINDYSGSETQNIKLLNTLKNQSNSSKIAEPTKNNTVVTDNNEKSNLLGVDDDTYNKAFNSSFTESDTIKENNEKREDALSNLESLTSKDQIVSDSVMSAINSDFVVPSAVKEADVYIASQLEKIQSGKTSYSDQVKDMLDKIMGREKFSYDVDTDPLFQQALASAMNSGKQAMQDTIGQASALTGGYGSTYATTAGNQAYNAFIEDAYDNLPQYYQMALEAYQMEGDEMYRQFGMLSELDDKEFNRNVTAYDATYAHRNQMYNEAYTQYRDNKADAFAMANLQLNEHGQKVSDAYNYYNAYSDYADTVYEREYNKWADEVNLATKYAEMLNTDAWANKNFDEGVRQYEKSFAEEQRQYNESLAEQKRQHKEQMSYNWASLNTKKEQQNEKETKLKAPNSTQIKGAINAYKSMGLKGYESFVENLGDDIDIDELFGQVASETTLGLYAAEIEKKKDAFWHWPGGVDKNDVVSVNGTDYKVSELPAELQSKISGAGEGTVYYYDWEKGEWTKK